jgi:DNA-binding response OmpR family regulator
MSAPLIAIVNDDTTFLQLMTDLLSDEGYATIIEKERGDAPKVIREHQPDLVILDIRMDHPESGMQILEIVRLDPQTTSVPVIICSADHQFLRDKEPLLRSKHCDILEKPFDLNDLLTKVEAAIGRPPARD